MMFLADTIAPEKPRNSCSVALYGFRLPRSASMDIAATMSDCLIHRSISWMCSADIAVSRFEPLIAASPSRACRPGASIPARFKASAPGSRSP